MLLVQIKLFYYLVIKNQNICNEFLASPKSLPEYYKNNMIFTCWFVFILNLKYRFLRYKHPPALPLSLSEAESGIYKRPIPHIFIHELLKYDIISFDVFDTLLLRPFDIPTDLFAFVGDKLKIKNFTNVRNSVQKKVQERKERETGSREVTIVEIYEEIEKETGIYASEGVRVEFETELEFIMPNPYMLRIFELLKYMGKRIIAVSDMYLSEAQIRLLLEKCSFYSFENIYVSSEYNLNKNNGLFRLVRDDIGSELTVFHIGDNFHADFFGAKKAGIDAYYYRMVREFGNKYRLEEKNILINSAYRGIVNAHLHNGLYQYSSQYEFGYITSGLYILEFCSWLHEHAIKNKVEKLFFIMQGGDIIQKAYNIIYNDVDNDCIFWPMTVEKNTDLSIIAGYYLRNFTGNYSCISFVGINLDDTDVLMLQNIFNEAVPECKSFYLFISQYLIDTLKCQNNYFNFLSKFTFPKCINLCIKNDKLCFNFTEPDVKTYNDIQEVYKGILDFIRQYIKTFVKYQFMFNITGNRELLK